ncbi:MAG: tol-pal system protein YbgF [Proteobacteria bacterium]|nr:tol-pal system protein YbgF [Pseudomonadota bacterium]MBU1739633.1 tol-pal system protein YbgF [Pseudomonadota bacterium]
MRTIIRLKPILSILAFSPFLIQCVASTQDVKNLDLRLRSMDNKLINMDRGMNDLKEETTNRANKNSVEALQKNLADTANTIDQLRTKLLQVKGQMEENAHQYQKLQETGNDYRDSMSGRLHDLNTAIENLRLSLDEQSKKHQELETRILANEVLIKQNANGIDSLRQARADAAAEQAKKAAEAAAIAARRAEEARERARLQAEAEEKARKAEAEAAAKARKRTSSPATVKLIEPEKEKKTVSQKTSTNKPSAAKAQSAASSKSSAAGNPYEKGMELFNAKKYQDAYASFSEYVEKFPTGDLVANARFWLGDSLYNQQEYELAILEYQKVIAEFPKHDKSPAALLKQGLAFEKLKDLETAKLVYYKLTDDYPESDQAETARSRLKVLK